MNKQLKSINKLSDLSPAELSEVFEKLHTAGAFKLECQVIEKDEFVNGNNFAYYFTIDKINTHRFCLVTGLMTGYFAHQKTYKLFVSESKEVFNPSSFKIRSHHYAYGWGQLEFDDTKILGLMYARFSNIMLESERIRREKEDKKAKEKKDKKEAIDRLKDQKLLNQILSIIK